jgi:hypothetical protein
MPRDTPEQDPTPEGTNIRSPEERFGGEGHAGTDPFARDRTGKRRDTRDDSPVEVPTARLDELSRQPATAPQRARDESGTPAGPADPTLGPHPSINVDKS